jgi:hypothetical protein
MRAPLDVLSDSCEDCPYNHYADELGQRECKSCSTSSCPSGQYREGCVTEGLKSDDSKCSGGCPPGTFGRLVDESYTSFCNIWASTARVEDRGKGTCLDIRVAQASECVACGAGKVHESFAKTHCEWCSSCAEGEFRQGCGNVSAGICAECTPG